MKYIVGIDEVGRGPLAGPVTVGVVVCEAELYKKLKRNRSSYRSYSKTSLGLNERITAHSSLACFNKNLPPAGKDSKRLSPQLRQNYVEVLENLKISLKPCVEEGLRSATGARLSQSPAGLMACPPRHTARKKFLDFHISYISNKTIDIKGLSFSIKSAIGKGIEKLKLDPKNCEVRLDGGLRAPTEFKNQKTIIRGDEKEKIIAWASILAKVSRDALMTRAGKKYPQYGFEIHKGYGTARHRLAISTHGLSPLHRKSFCKNIHLRVLKK